MRLYSIKWNCPKLSSATTPSPLSLLNHRKFLLITLLLLFLIYCAYTSSACVSNQLQRGRDFLVGRIFVATSSLLATAAEPPSTNNSQLIIRNEAVPHRTRSCANELTHYSSIREEKEASGNRRLPSALIIGVKKSGTRALLEFIRFHPDVRASGCEVHFFDRHYNKGLRWYRHRMPVTRPGQVTMEKTPSYFITREVPKRIYKMEPKTRLLLVVRDPVTRAVSDYTQAITKLTTTRRFEELAFVNGSRGEIYKAFVF